MAWFRKNEDPISERSRALTEQIRHLEAQIKRLSEQPPPSPLRFRSTTHPGGQQVMTSFSSSARETLFEELDQARLKVADENGSSDQFNELGVRKYDLAGAWGRLKNHFRGPSASNPRLVNYLAAGSVQGLRPLRYEKRVARNRFIVLVVVLVLVLFGILKVFFGS